MLINDSITLKTFVAFAVIFLASYCVSETGENEKKTNDVVVLKTGIVDSVAVESVTCWEVSGLFEAPFSYIDEGLVLGLDKTVLTEELGKRWSTQNCNEEDENFRLGTIGISPLRDGPNDPVTPIRIERYLIDFQPQGSKVSARTTLRVNKRLLLPGEPVG